MTSIRIYTTNSPFDDDSVSLEAVRIECDPIESAGMVCGYTRVLVYDTPKSSVWFHVPVGGTLHIEAA